jgi:hypothetical protein
MQCPACHTETALGWGRYLRSPLGNHTCPACAVRLRPRTTWRFYAAVVATWLLVLGASLWAMAAHGLSLAVTLALHFVLGFGILLPIDRWLDDRVRRVELRGES